MKSSYSIKFLLLVVLSSALIIGMIGGAIYSPINLYRTRLMTLKGDPRVISLQRAFLLINRVELIRYNLENSTAFFNCASKNICDDNLVLQFPYGDQSKPFASFDLSGKSCFSENCPIRIEVEVHRENDTFPLRFSILPLEKEAKSELMAQLQNRHDSVYMDSLDQIAFDATSVNELQKVPSWIDRIFNKIKFKPNMISIEDVNWQTAQVDLELQALDHESIVNGTMSLEESASEIQIALRSEEQDEILIVKHSNSFIQKNSAINSSCSMAVNQDEIPENLKIDDPSLLLRNIYAAKICYSANQLDTPCTQIKVVLNSKKVISIGQSGYQLCGNSDDFVARMSSIVHEARAPKKIGIHSQKAVKL